MVNFARPKLEQDIVIAASGTPAGAIFSALTSRFPIFKALEFGMDEVKGVVDTLVPDKSGNPGLEGVIQKWDNVYKQLQTIVNEGSSLGYDEAQCRHLLSTIIQAKSYDEVGGILFLNELFHTCISSSYVDPKLLVLIAINSVIGNNKFDSDTIIMSVKDLIDGGSTGTFNLNVILKLALNGQMNEVKESFSGYSLEVARVAGEIPNLKKILNALNMLTGVRIQEVSQFDKYEEEKVDLQFWKSKISQEFAVNLANYARFKNQDLAEMAMNWAKTSFPHLLKTPGYVAFMTGLTSLTKGMAVYDGFKNLINDKDVSISDNSGNAFKGESGGMVKKNSTSIFRKSQQIVPDSINNKQQKNTNISESINLVFKNLAINKQNVDLLIGTIQTKLNNVDLSFVDNVVSSLTSKMDIKSDPKIEIFTAEDIETNIYKAYAEIRLYQENINKVSQFFKSPDYLIGRKDLTTPENTQFQANELQNHETGLQKTIATITYIQGLLPALTYIKEAQQTLQVWDISQEYLSNLPGSVSTFDITLRKSQIYDYIADLFIKGANQIQQSLQGISQQIGFDYSTIGSKIIRDLRIKGFRLKNAINIAGMKSVMKEYGVDKNDQSMIA